MHYSIFQTPEMKALQIRPLQVVVLCNQTPNSAHHHSAFCSPHQVLYELLTGRCALANVATELGEDTDLVCTCHASLAAKSDIIS